MKFSSGSAFAFVAIMVCALPVRAQVSAEAEVSAMADDNVNNNALHLSDRIVSSVLQLGYDWTTDRTNTALQYHGGYNYYTLVPGRTNQFHGAGFTYAALFGEDEETLVNAGLSYGARTDREEYAYYDNTVIGLSGTLKHQFSPAFTGKAGYTMRLMRFANLATFNHTEHQFQVQGSAFLPSRTTIIGEVTFGMKLYSTPNQDSSSSGMGRGRGSSALSSPGVTQLAGSVRIGQPLFEKTGLSLAGGYQLNLRKDTRYLGSASGSIADDEIFDDRYGYEGPQGSLMLTQVLPWDAKARLTGSWQRRTYTTQPAYDAAGMMLAARRIDTRTALNLAITVPVSPLGFTLGMAYDRIWNTSNDPFYGYGNNAFTVQISYP